MTRLEYLTCRTLLADTGREAPEEGVQFYRRAGWSEHALEGYRVRFGGFGKYVHALPDSYRRLTDGEVLDIGGQDTKGIQVDENGIVVNFQMNDRCAAGCGRYLGYIADEMNMGLHELGPLAMKATKTIPVVMVGAGADPVEAGHVVGVHLGAPVVLPAQDGGRCCGQPQAAPQQQQQHPAP